MLQKPDEAVRWQTAVCEVYLSFLRFLHGGLHRSASAGWQEPALPPVAGPIPVTELPVDTCRVGVAAKNKDAF